ncbi:MAG TPA: PAS domain S-box protein [Desulfomonilaceae bacterium]|nr:PAS domain S-box protein [Desulfomonilaceae bacterium]
MFEESPLAAAVVSGDNEVIALNPSLSRMLGLKQNELTGLTLVDIIHPEDVRDGLELAERLFGGKIPHYKIQLRFMRKSGQPFRANVTASLIRDDGTRIPYSLHIIEDITELEHSVESDEGPGEIAAGKGQAERALRESNERIRAIVEAANDPIIGADSSGHIVMWNSAATSTFGYSAEEVINQPVNLLMPERFAAVHEPALQRAVESGRLYYSKRVREVFGRRKDGTEFPVEVSISASKNQLGMFFTAIIRDITERKQKDEQLRKANEELESRVAERTAELVHLNENLRQEIKQRERIEEMLRNSELLYHTLVEEVPDVIFVLDKAGRFTYLNAQAQKLLGRPLPELLDTPLVSYVVVEERDKIESIFRLHRDSIWDEEIRLLDADEEMKFARIRCKALGDDGKGDVRFEGVMRDITRRRRLEEQLKESREQLLEKIQIIDDLYAHIVESGKARAIAEHTAEVAHELRQPLTIIGGFARRIARQLNFCNITTDAGQAEAVRIISTEIQRLEKILNTLLDFTRRESVSQQIANPHYVIEKVLNVYQQVLAEKELKLDVTFRREVGEIFVDPERFEQVVRNLISNAIDASPVGETLHIETGVSVPGSRAVETAALESDRYFEMKIRNRGPAITEEDLRRIFSPFSAADRYGTGIGLAVSKKIVEAHDGSISVHTDETGTTFTVWLPLNRPGVTLQRLA